MHRVSVLNAQYTWDSTFGTIFRARMMSFAGINGLSGMLEPGLFRRLEIVRRT